MSVDVVSQLPVLRGLTNDIQYCNAYIIFEPFTIVVNKYLNYISNRSYVLIIIIENITKSQMLKK